MNITRNAFFQALAFTVATLAATAGLVAASLAAEPAQEGKPACIFCARP